MRVVYKYKIHKFNHQLAIPVGAKFLHAEYVQNDFCVWYEVETSNKEVILDLIILLTGQEFPEGLFRHIATVFEGRLVWHLYQRQS